MVARERAGRTPNKVVDVICEVFRSKDGWRWRLKSKGNRKIGATSEAYSCFARAYDYAWAWTANAGIPLLIRESDKRHTNPSRR